MTPKEELMNLMFSTVSGLFYGHPCNVLANEDMVKRFLIGSSYFTRRGCLKSPVCHHECGERSPESPYWREILRFTQKNNDWEKDFLDSLHIVRSLLGFEGGLSPDSVLWTNIPENKMEDVDYM